VEQKWVIIWMEEKPSGGHITGRNKGKAIPLKALTGPEDSRRLRLPNFKTIGT
jgi:hypothetical protein